MQKTPCRCLGRETYHLKGAQEAFLIDLEYITFNIKNQ